MQHIIGVTELQRKFRTVFDDVVSKRIPVILTRGSRPEAALISYEDYLRFQQMQESEVLAHFDTVWNRLAEVNAGISADKLAADIQAAEVIVSSALDQIGRALKAKGISLEDLIERGREIRGEIIDNEE
jgi:prevent-host-death family protein